MESEGTPPQTISARTRAVVDRLAAEDRPPGSTGEARAAELLARELTDSGLAARIEPERVHGTYSIPIGLASLTAAGAGVVRSRPLATTLAAGAALSISDDLEIGARPLRQILQQRVAHNVLAEAAPREPDGRVLVVHAHHDAARTGLIFHPAGAKLLASAAGGLIEKIGATPAPMWGAVLGPALVGTGAALGFRWIRRLGSALSGAYAAAMANIASSHPVPGANDNLSGVAVLLELADRIARRRPARLRVLLLSTGSEESFLEAMVRFGERHFGELRREQTSFLCVESVGSPELMLLSGEGLLRLVRYPPAPIRHLSDLAERIGVQLRPPFRYRLATDGQVPHRAGYRTAVMSSMDWYKAPSNYHWPSDRPENLHWQSVGAAASLAEAYVRSLDETAASAGDAGEPLPARTGLGHGFEEADSRAGESRAGAVHG